MQITHILTLCLSVFNFIFEVVVVLRSPIHANEPSEYNGMLYRSSNRVLNNGIKVIILICMDGTSQYHHYHFWHLNHVDIYDTVQALKYSYTSIVIKITVMGIIEA